MKRRFLFLTFLSITLLVLILLVTGSSLLMLPLNEAKTIPLGTFISWIGLLALPLTIFWGLKSLRHPKENWEHFLSIFLKIMIGLALLWLPISYGLSGNMASNFSGYSEGFQGGPIAMQIYWVITYSIPLSSLILLVAYWLSKMIVALKSK